MSRDKFYEGLENDNYGGMSHQGQIIRDAWVFGLLPETETCTGWSIDRIQALYDKVAKEWEKYGLLASNLPPDLREKHSRVHAEALEKARSLGWNAELGEDD